MKTKLSLLAILLIMIAAFSCKKYTLDNSSNEAYSSVPVLPEVPYNYSNSSNDALAALGRVLFYDKNLSLNNSIACAGCHQQSKAFCDNMQFSIGLENLKTSRNSPSIFAKSGRMFWDGRARNGIQDLVLMPVKNHIEMKFENLSALAKKLNGVAFYAPLFLNAFGSAQIDSSRIKSALAEFISNFNFSNNKFNRSLKNQATLTTSETLGKLIFFGKGKCSNCHHIENQFSPFDSTKAGYGFTNSDFNIGLDKEYRDNGIGVITGNPSDNGKFMVPVLLNVEYTAPYMHDGRFKTLEEVVEHYSTGIQNHPNLDFKLRNAENLQNMTQEQLLIKYDINHNGVLDASEMQSIMEPIKLNFTPTEKRCLVDFLKTLSDPSILIETKFSDPFTGK